MSTSKLHPVRYSKYIAGITSSPSHPDLASILKGGFVAPRTTAALASYLDQMQPILAKACSDSMFAGNKRTLNLNLARSATKRLFTSKKSREDLDAWCTKRVEAYRQAVEPAKQKAAAKRKLKAKPAAAA